MVPGHPSLEAFRRELVDLRGRQQLVLVAIDGPGGAGKSTLAGELARSLSAQVVPGDDFYRVMDAEVRLALTPAEGARRYFDWERMRDEVLRPLRAARPAHWRRYDWPGDRLADEAMLPPSGIVIVEGVYTFRPELRTFYDRSALVTVPREEALRRLRARGHNSPEWIARWDAAEQWYFAHELRPDDVDAVVPGIGPR